MGIFSFNLVKFWYKYPSILKLPLRKVTGRDNSMSYFWISHGIKCPFGNWFVYYNVLYRFLQNDWFLVLFWSLAQPITKAFKVTVCSKLCILNLRIYYIIYWSLPDMSEPQKKKPAMTTLDQLKNLTVIVADTGDFEC